MTSSRAGPDVGRHIVLIARLLHPLADAPSGGSAHELVDVPQSKKHHLGAALGKRDFHWIEANCSGRRGVSRERDLDVRNEVSIQRMAGVLEERGEQVHILVNNAGCNVRKPALDVT